MSKSFVNSATPITSEKWRGLKQDRRIEMINNELKKNKLYDGFKVVEVPDNGQIVLKIERSIPANKRGLLLLDLEEKLKFAVDKGISIWLEPVGDKSKLRNLRGIEFK
jgi:bifunctional DNA-binding transcriptional regulator/antitoxin component of YhaV-PrlF toxin-antitoxin module